MERRYDIAFCLPIGMVEVLIVDDYVIIGYNLNAIKDFIE